MVEQRIKIVVSGNWAIIKRLMEEIDNLPAIFPTLRVDIKYE